MSYSLTIRSLADADLVRTAEWYEGERLGLGAEFLNEFLRTCKAVQRFPSRHSFANREKGVRRCRFKKFPYLIYFTINEPHVIVHAVLHIRRSPSVWERRFEE